MKVSLIVSRNAVIILTKKNAYTYPRTKRLSLFGMLLQIDKIIFDDKTQETFPALRERSKVGQSLPRFFLSFFSIVYGIYEIK